MDMTFPELQSWLESHGHKGSRATILWGHLYGNGKWVESPDVIPRSNKEFVSLLEERAEFAPNLQLGDVHTARDGTWKLVFFVEEYNASVETIVIPGPRGRITVCVSSQLGCAMNCQFCFTAKMGLRGNLSTAQIVELVVVASRMCSEDLGQVTNVVFMGIGEPLHNLDSVIRAAEIMVSDQGLHLSPRKVTISTSGPVPQIRTFCRKSKCALAVSLNATTDEIRDRIMLINRKYNIRTFLDCVKEELITHRPGESLFFEYVMLKNIKDSEDDSARLVELVKDIPCKINLIKFNSHPGSAFEPTPLAEVLKFRDRVADAGFVVIVAAMIRRWLVASSVLYCLGLQGGENKKFKSLHSIESFIQTIRWWSSYMRYEQVCNRPQVMLNDFMLLPRTLSVLMLSTVGLW